MRAIINCMAWRAIPSRLSKLHGRLDSLRLLSALNRYPSQLERKAEYFASPRNKAGLPGTGVALNKRQELNWLNPGVMGRV